MNQIRYLSSTLREIENYQCSVQPNEELYSIISKSSNIFLKYILSEFNSCVESEIVYIRYTEDEDIKIVTPIRLSKRCSNSDIIIYPVVQKRLNNRPGHQMIIIVNRITEEIEFFEPNGSPYYYWIAETIFDEMYNVFPDYRYIYMLDYCIYPGPQAISEKSVCVLFSLLYVLIRIREPHLSREEIIQEITLGDKRQINIIIDNFLCWVYDIIYLGKLNLTGFYDLVGSISSEFIRIIRTISGGIDFIDQSQLEIVPAKLQKIKSFIANINNASQIQRFRSKLDTIYRNLNDIDVQAGNYVFINSSLISINRMLDELLLDIDND